MLDVADPAERATQAETLMRAKKAVQFDATKPSYERTLPDGLIEKLLLSDVPVEIDNGIFFACDLSYETINARLTLRNCVFVAFRATAATFRSGIDMNGSAFGDLQLAHCDLLDADLKSITVANACEVEHAHVRGVLDLSASKFAILILAGASIDAHLVLDGAAATTINAQGLSVNMNLTATGAHIADDPHFSDWAVGGNVMLADAVFDALFSVSGVAVQGNFNIDGVTANAGVNFEKLSCTELSMKGAMIIGDAIVLNVKAPNVELDSAEIRGKLRFGQGSVGFLGLENATVGGQLALAFIQIQGANISGTHAAELFCLTADCNSVFANDAPRPSRFGSVTMLQSKFDSLWPANWDVSGTFALTASTIETVVIEHNNDIGSLVITDTKIGRTLIVRNNVVRGGVHLNRIAADGPVVFRSNTIAGNIDIERSAFGRLDFQAQALPKVLTCTSSTVDQLVFDKLTSTNASADDSPKGPSPPPRRYDGRTIDLENSTYEQITCSVVDLMRCLAPKPSRQQFVVLERALRRSGFDELGDIVYRAGRTRYTEAVKSTNPGIWIRGKIADWTTGYGLDIPRITMLTFAVPLIVFALVLVSPGTASESDAAQPCAGLQAWTTAAAAVFATYLGEGSTKAHLTECSLLGLLPAHALALPLRLLGLILIPIWLAIATGILKYADKSGD